MQLLVLNCHEPWVYQLRVLGAQLDLVVDLPGRKVRGWDSRMRPLPDAARLLTLDQALAAQPDSWDAVICHNITDLLDTASIDAPKLLVLHDTLDGRMAQQGADFDREAMVRLLGTYLARLGAHAVPVTVAKGSSWGVPGKPLHCSADPADYPLPTYVRPAGLRVANHIASKRVFLAWDFHLAAFDGVPVTIVGDNPEFGIRAAADWDALKCLFAEHRFFIHTADPRYEDGFNMAMVEAMAAGLPVVGNAHPTSPITHGVDGFLAESPGDAREFAGRLLADEGLARTMGEAARRTAARLFSTQAFRAGSCDAIDRARKKFRRRLRRTTASSG